MELRYRREAAVGLLLILGTAAFVVLMMWLRGKSFKEGEIVHAVFDDVSGLKEGDPVRTSGVSVGSVKQIRLVRPGAVDVYFDIQRGPPPRDDARAEIRSADLFGARIVEYFPGMSPTSLPRGQAGGVYEQEKSLAHVEIFRRGSRADPHQHDADTATGLSTRSVTARARVSVSRFFRAHRRGGRRRTVGRGAS